jgi:hypothetical protein
LAIESCSNGLDGRGSAITITLVPTITGAHFANFSCLLVVLPAVGAGGLIARNH